VSFCNAFTSTLHSQQTGQLHHTRLQELASYLEKNRNISHTAKTVTNTQFSDPAEVVLHTRKDLSWNNQKVELKSAAYAGFHNGIQSYISLLTSHPIPILDSVQTPGYIPKNPVGFVGVSPRKKSTLNLYPILVSRTSNNEYNELFY